MADLDHLKHVVRVRGMLIGSDAAALLAEVERLRDGIRRHRGEVLATDAAEPGSAQACDAADRTLWALLDDRTEDA